MLLKIGYFLFVIIIIIAAWLILYFKRKVDRINKIYNTLKMMPQKFYIKEEDEEFTNISQQELKSILKMDLNNEKEYSIVKIENGFYIDRESIIEQEIDILADELDAERDRMREEKDMHYYLYKEMGMKLGFILQEIAEAKRECDGKSTGALVLKMENIKSKMEFLINFIFGKFSVNFYKYRLYSLEVLTKIIESEFKENVELNFLDNTNIKEKFYVEEEKFYLFIKAVIYSLIKKWQVRIVTEISLEDKLLKIFLSKWHSEDDSVLLGEEDFFEISAIKNNDWKAYIEGEKFVVNIPVKNGIDENIKEEKAIEISSDLKNIKTVEKNIIYDMYTKNFSEKKIKDVKLLIDEIVTNAIEHGNHFDDSKKVIITYKFKELYNECILIIEIEDEGNGFDINKIKNPELNNERGRGIFILRKIADSVEYKDDGKRVIVYIKRGNKNDTE